MNGSRVAPLSSTQRGAGVLYRMLADDETHGDENKEILQGWLRSWSEDAIAAARQLQPIWSQISEKVVRFEDSLERSLGRQETLVGDIGLETQKEVVA